MDSFKQLSKLKNIKKIHRFTTLKWRLARKHFIMDLQTELRSKQKNLFNFNKIIHELRDQIFKHLKLCDLILFSQTNTCMQNLVNNFLTNQNIEASLYFYKEPATIDGVALKYNETTTFNAVNSVICYNGGGVEKLCANFHALKNISKITFIGYTNFYHYDTRFIRNVIFYNLKTVVISESTVDTVLYEFLRNHHKRIQYLEIENCIIEKFPKSIDFDNLKTFKCDLPYHKCKFSNFLGYFICESHTLEKVFVNRFVFRIILYYIISHKNVTSHRIKSLTVFPSLKIVLSSYLTADVIERIFKKFEHVI